MPNGFDLVDSQQAVSFGSVKLLTSTRQRLDSLCIDLRNFVVVEPPPLAVLSLSLASDGILDALLLDEGGVVAAVGTGTLMCDDAPQLVQASLVGALIGSHLGVHKREDLFLRSQNRLGALGFNRARHVMQYRRMIAERASWDDALAKAATG